MSSLKKIMKRNDWALFSILNCLPLTSCVLLHIYFGSCVWRKPSQNVCYCSIIGFSLVWFQHLRDRLQTRHHQSHKIDISYCKHWHIHPCKAKVIISGFGGWKKSIPLFPMVETGSLFVITQSDSYATFQRLQGKVICLLRVEPDLGKPAPGWIVHSVRDN